MIPGTRIPESAWEAALQRAEGVAVSYVTHRGATVGHVTGQYRSAEVFGAPADIIKVVGQSIVHSIPTLLVWPHLTRLFNLN